MSSQAACLRFGQPSAIVQSVVSATTHDQACPTTLYSVQKLLHHAAGGPSELGTALRMFQANEHTTLLAFRSYGSSRTTDLPGLVMGKVALPVEGASAC